jgi:hypothetical protein
LALWKPAARSIWRMAGRKSVLKRALVDMLAVVYLWLRAEVRVARVELSGEVDSHHARCVEYRERADVSECRAL